MIPLAIVGFAGAVASTITCPIEVVKTQLQSSRVGGGSNPVQVAREIWAAEGAWSIDSFGQAFVYPSALSYSGVCAFPPPLYLPLSSPPHTHPPQA